MVEIKISRNDSCICGSGKKYKKCCIGTSKVLELESSHSAQYAPILAKQKERLRSRQNGDRHVEFKSSIKMSEVIKAFASEILELAENGEQTKFAIESAIIFWNLCVVANDNSEKVSHTIEEMLSTLTLTSSHYDKTKVKEMFLYYKARKAKLFSEVDRLIMDYELEMMGEDDFHLTVVSAIKPNDKELLNLDMKLDKRILERV